MQKCKYEKKVESESMQILQLRTIELLKIWRKVPYFSTPVDFFIYLMVRVFIGSRCIEAKHRLHMYDCIPLMFNLNNTFNIYLMASESSCTGLDVDGGPFHEGYCDGDSGWDKLGCCCFLICPHLVRKLAVHDLFPNLAHSFYGDFRYFAVGETVDI